MYAEDGPCYSKCDEDDTSFIHILVPAWGEVFKSPSQILTLDVTPDPWFPPFGGGFTAWL